LFETGALVELALHSRKARIGNQVRLWSKNGGKENMKAVDAGELLNFAH